MAQVETGRSFRRSSREWLAAAIAALAGFALGLQLWLVLVSGPRDAASLGFRIANYFSFFTILTNLLVAVSLSVPLLRPRSRLGRFLQSPFARAAVAVSIAIVGLTYSLALRHLWNPTGAQKLADVLLHDAVPLLYVAWWARLAPKHGLRWSHALLWLAYPALYMVYTLLRGTLTGWWPYPFIDVAILGLPRALAHSALVFAAFFSLGLLAVAVGRWTPRPAPSSPSDRV